MFEIILMLNRRN